MESPAVRCHKLRSRWSSRCLWRMVSARFGAAVSAVPLPSAVRRGRIHLLEFIGDGLLRQGGAYLPASGYRPGAWCGSCFQV